MSRSAVGPFDGSLGAFAVIDGGLSTALEELGEQPTGVLWTAQTLLDRPEVVEAAHRAAVGAGADVVITASYQASEEGFVAAGLDGRDARRLLASTTAVARRSGAAVVACSLGPYGAICADGSEYHGRYAASWTEVAAFHRRRIEVLVDTGPDLFAIETMPSGAEATIVLDELRRLTSAPAWVAFTCRDATSTCAGDEFAAVAGSLSTGATWVGVNCTAVEHIAPLLRSADPGAGFVVYPNRGGGWDPIAKCWVAPDPRATIADHAAEWFEIGAVAIGGCCGVGHADVAAIAARRDTITSARPLG